MTNGAPSLSRTERVWLARLRVTSVWFTGRDPAVTRLVNRGFAVMANSGPAARGRKTTYAVTLTPQGVLAAAAFP